MNAPTVEGIWLIPSQEVELALTQKGPSVTGTLKGKDFKCEVTGSFDGRQLSINWKSYFSWTNRQDSGQGTLLLSPDNSSLSGYFILFGIPGTWTLRRQGAAAATQPAAPPVDPVELIRRAAAKQRHVSPAPKAPLFSSPSERKAKDDWDDKANDSWRQAIGDNDPKHRQVKPPHNKP